MRASLLAGSVKTLESAVAALDPPSTVADGESITSWRSGSKAPRDALIRIAGSATISLTGAYVAGWDGTLWHKIKTLDATIALTVTLGFADVVEYAGLYERLAVAGTPDAGNFTVTATPIELVQAVV